MSPNSRAVTEDVTSHDLEVFRTHVRQWLGRNCPPSMRTPMRAEEIPWGGRQASFPDLDTKLWLDRMAERGWTAPLFPVAYGGGGLTAAEATVLQEELTRVQARPALFSFGIWMLGPVLLEYGTEEQKARFLPPIIRGEVRWCQGYSEPNAGSDLASLRMKAERVGDEFVVTGSKIWTTYSDKSDWIFCLVRTDFTAAKHRGISFLLINLESPGVVRKPIDLISGESPFCETFFDEVRVPAENLIGPLNGGWEIAKRLLQYERQNVAAAGFGAETRRPLQNIVLERDALADPVKRDNVVHQLLHSEAIALFAAKNERLVASGNPSPLVSVVKILSAKSNQARSDVLIDAIGLEALGDRDDADAGVDPAVREEAIREAAGWLRSRANSIEGGTSEINLNILAKAVLGLPGA